MFKFLKSKKKLIDEIEELANENYRLRNKLENEQVHNFQLKEEIKFLRKRKVEFKYSEDRLGMASAMADAMERAIKKSREEAIREKIYNDFVNKITTRAWHETSCPAHSDQMGPESDCNCLFKFVKKQAKRIIKN